jgi:peroxiredoxin
VGRWQREQAGRLTLAVISRGSAQANRAKSAEHSIGTLLLQQDDEVADSYRADGTPAAVLVGADGRIASPLAEGADAIRALVARASSGANPSPAASARPPAEGSNGSAQAAPGSPRRRGPEVGDAAPPLRLPDLSGAVVDLADFRGSRTLVLFWNPGCAFCARMLPDLQAWETNPPAGAPRLLVVSMGSPEDNRAQGLRAPLVLDQEFRVGRAFGLSGTPSAVLVDEQGRLTAEPAAGAPGVWALANPDAAPSIPNARIPSP